MANHFEFCTFFIFNWYNIGYYWMDKNHGPIDGNNSMSFGFHFGRYNSISQKTENNCCNISSIVFFKNIGWFSSQWTTCISSTLTQIITDFIFWLCFFSQCIAPAGAHSPLIFLPGINSKRPDQRNLAWLFFISIILAS